jgi:secreted trypsin-like serine protease
MSIRRLVVGGVALTIDQAPFLVRLYTEATNYGFCGGTLVAERTVLTAAHCVTSNNNSNYTVYVGTYQNDIIGDLINPNSDVVRVTNVHIHPEYDPSDIGQGNDVAVLTLLRAPSKYGTEDGPRAIALGNGSFWPRISDQPSDSAYVIGYGSESYTGPQSFNARAAHVHLYTEFECRQFLGFTLSPSNLCAGLPDSDSCLGDSGGPLIVAYNGQFVQVGIVSWGLSAVDCGELPGVYSRTSSAYGMLQSYNVSYIDYNAVNLSFIDPCACTSAEACVSNGFDVAPRCGCADHVADGIPFCYVANDECATATHSLFVIGALYQTCALPPPLPPLAPPSVPPLLPPPFVPLGPSNTSCRQLRTSYKAQSCCIHRLREDCVSIKRLYVLGQCTAACSTRMSE